ncbi:MAG: ABC transporter ATP-binding protein [Acidimicrobiales bacterium]
MSVITVRNVVKSYGKQPVLRGVDLHVERGEVLGLLGRNGAGKSTLVECMQGLRTIDGGVIDVLGIHPSRDQRALHRVIGSQLQSSGLPDRLRVREAIRVFARNPRADVDEILDQNDLTAISSKYVGRLSGGQRQRLFVALAWLDNPQVVFLDEMTQGLDAEAREAVWSDVKRRQGADTTIVVVSHFADELEALCDRVAVLADGRITATGSPAELLDTFGLPAALELDQEPLLEWFRHVPGVRLEQTRSGWRVWFPPKSLPAVGAALDAAGYDGAVAMRPANLGDVLRHTSDPVVTSGPTTKEVTQV